MSPGHHGKRGQGLQRNPRKTCRSQKRTPLFAFSTWHERAYSLAFDGAFAKIGSSPDLFIRSFVAGVVNKDTFAPVQNTKMGVAPT